MSNEPYRYYRAVLKLSYVFITVLIVWNVFHPRFRPPFAEVYKGSRRIDILLKGSVILTGSLNVDGIRNSDFVWNRIPSSELHETASFSVESRNVKDYRLKTPKAGRGIQILVEGIGIAKCDSLDIISIGQSTWRVNEKTFTSTKLDTFLHRRLVLDWNPRLDWKRRFDQSIEADEPLLEFMPFTPLSSSRFEK